MAAHGVDRVCWYDSIDDGADPANLEDRFGLFRAPTSVAPDAYEPRPAAAVLATVARLAAGRSSSTGSMRDGVRTVRFDGAELRWSTDNVPRAAEPWPSAVSMTGRVIGRSDEVGSGPVWTRAG